MGYLEEVGQKWGESGTLFIAAFLSSFFLIFILIEPLLSAFYQSKQGVESSIIQAQLRSQSSNNLNTNPSTIEKSGSLETNQEIPAQSNSEKEVAASPKTTITPDPSGLPPSNPTTHHSVTPDRFAFNAAPNIEAPDSVPILGGRSGFRPKAPSAPGPKKDRDSISEKGLAEYRNQIGEEVDKRHAQGELAQLMGSLETEEEYLCTLRTGGAINQKSAKGTLEIKVQCKPNSPKSLFLEMIIRRLSNGQACTNINVSKLNGIQQKECAL